MDLPASCPRCGNARATEEELAGLCPTCAFTLALSDERAIDPGNGARAWLRRHRLGASFGIAVLVLFGSLLLTTRARTARAERIRSVHERISLAFLYGDQGRPAEAEALLRATLPEAARAFGPEHPDTLRAMHRLGVVILAEGRAREAENVLRDTLEIRRRVLGPGHPDTLETMTQLARTYDAQDRPTEAELLRQEIRKTGAPP